jgi:hypothetical protein
LKEEFYISLIGEAFDGYTESVFRDKAIYLKHVSIKDQRYLHKYYEKYKQIAISKGLEKEEDRIKYVLDEEIWSEADDNKIASLEYELENLKRTVKELFLQSQRQEMQKTIDEKIKEVYELREKRKEVMGKTAEDYASTRSSDEILRFLLFKDKELSEHLFTEEEFGELETWEVLELISLQKDVSERLSDPRLQEAVLRPFFSMYLSFSEDLYGFYGKPVTLLTVYQLRVVVFSKMFFNIFQYTDNIPDDIRDDPEKLIAFADSSKSNSAKKGGLKDNADQSFAFGATKDDIRNLGGNEKAPSLRDEAKKHGGKLNMQQMMRLAGHDV